MDELSQRVAGVGASVAGRLQSGKERLEQVIGSQELLSKLAGANLTLGLVGGALGLTDRITRTVLELARGKRMAELLSDNILALVTPRVLETLGEALRLEEQRRELRQLAETEQRARDLDLVTRLASDPGLRAFLAESVGTQLEGLRRLEEAQGR